MVEVSAQFAEKRALSGADFQGQGTRRELRGVDKLFDRRGVVSIVGDLLLLRPEAIRVVFKELFPKGLTIADPAEVSGLNSSLSNIAARQDLRDLVMELNLPDFKLGF